MSTISINSFSLTIAGLQISYAKSGANFITNYDPLATCNLLKDAGLIEDYTGDKNGEPVILYTDNNEPQGYGFELWCYFVKSFPMGSEVAQMLIEYKEGRKVYNTVMAKINYLLHPLKATA